MNKPTFTGVIQFVHPGQEHKSTKTGWQGWSFDRHARKFMLSNGNWIDSNSKMNSGEFTFWGEWEAQSEIISTAPSAPGLPQNIVIPRFGGPINQVDSLMNTDPYVFGDQFKYTLCKQSMRSGSSTYLSRLTPGTLILFGSVVNGYFTLDTALVVGNSTLKHSRSTWEDEISSSLTETYKEVTMKPMYWDKYVPDEVTYSLYSGATPSSPVNEMYSFFPCLPSEPGKPLRFARPIINLEGVINHASKQAPKGTAGDSEMIKKCWISVVEQVRAQGLSLGVHAVEPVATAIPEPIRQPRQ
jgi:hypothetical protein